MNNFNFESHSEGDWEDAGHLSWNEHDWQQYLQRTDEEVGRFSQYYKSSKDQPNYLDNIAHLMGWDDEDWAVGAETDEEQMTETALEIEGNASLEEDDDDNDPYTLHRHPVYVVVRALYADIRRDWNTLLESPGLPLFSMKQLWGFSSILYEGEMALHFAVVALDMGDVALAVCHFKKALFFVNQAFAQMSEWEATRKDTLTHALIESCFKRLFDVREICLRVMQDCREEFNRQNKDL
jgi:hypothetical protein